MLKELLIDCDIEICVSENPTSKEIFEHSLCMYTSKNALFLCPPS